MKALGGGELRLPSFLPSAVDGTEWSNSLPSHFTPGKELRYPVVREPSLTFSRREKSLKPAGIRSHYRTVHSLIIVTNTLGRPLMSCCYGGGLLGRDAVYFSRKVSSCWNNARCLLWELEWRSAGKMKATGSSKTSLPVYVKQDSRVWGDRYFLLVIINFTADVCVDENYSFPCHILWCQGSWISFSLSISSLWMCSGSDFIRQNYLYY